ncbi:MAG: ferredoxin family protein [Bryobacterales bacterium]|nr:ferredoxin family protein [Bryobacterales bacterium]
MTHPKVPREKIPWFPVINADACIHDRECIDFCRNDVFDWNEALGLPEVNRPNNCVVACDACAQICPSEAISFPDPTEFKATMRKLISEAYREAEASDLVSVRPG